MSCSTAPRSRRRRRAARRPPVELARLDWAWLRFAPLSFSSLAGIGIVAGALFNLLNEAGANPGGSRATPSSAWPGRAWRPPSG